MRPTKSSTITNFLYFPPILTVFAEVLLLKATAQLWHIVQTGFNNGTYMRLSEKKTFKGNDNVTSYRRKNENRFIPYTRNMSYTTDRYTFMGENILLPSGSKQPTDCCLEKYMVENLYIIITLISLFRKICSTFFNF